MKYSRTLQMLTGVPWAILPEKLEEITAAVNARLIAEQPIPEAFVVSEPEARRGDIQVVGKTAILRMMGTISQRANLLTEFSGGTSTEQFSAQFQQAIANPNIKTVLIEVDSPGGTTFGVQELAEEIFAARDSGKKIIAHINSLGASAAFWLASQAHEIVLTPGGVAGSIGVFCLHLDHSRALDAAGIQPTFIKAGKFKVEGNELEPLEDEALAALQEQVDFVFKEFVKAVARGRGVSASDVRAKFGDGRILNAKQAKAVGMVDRVEPFAGTLNRLGANMSQLRADTAGIKVWGCEEIVELTAPRLTPEDGEGMTLPIEDAKAAAEDQDTESTSDDQQLDAELDRREAADRAERIARERALAQVDNNRKRLRLKERAA